ncbi:MAG: AAA family ATPase [Actinomycetota bacterium]|nr:AAA family ATPase [Actinomycetota bacterium]MDQ6945913.1 AAA family ATPase [Actinomycetota bacterium]
MTYTATRIDVHDKELISERAVNERYQRALMEALGRARQIGRNLTRARNEIWVGAAPKVPAPRTASALVGRVAFDVDDEQLGRGFYIGCWYEEWPGVQVISWAAPVAELFYRGRASNDALAPNVIATRTFVARQLDLADFIDDVERDVSVDQHPFAHTGRPTLAVPAAPRPGPRPQSRPQPSAPRRLGRPKPQSPPAKSVEARETTGERTAPTPPPVRTDGGSGATRNGKAGSAAPAPEHLRAEQAVLAAVESPRTGRLTSVLATLQPGQYRLVTWADNVPLIVQGQPGTGKTVIAAYRAAHLTHPQRETPPPLARVVLVGPTDQYVAHVTDVIHEIGEGAARVQVLSLPRFMCELAGIEAAPRHVPDEQSDTEWALGRLLEQAAAVLGTAKLPGKHKKRVQALVNALVKRDPAIEHLLAGNAERAAWLAGLGSYDRAANYSRYLPFLAMAGRAVRPPVDRDRWDHLLVDEAQDVCPLEWRILTSFLRPEATRAMSLFGDVNQRRSDWSPAGWQTLATDLQLTDDDGTFTPEVIDTGFRSTEKILRFANQLLPTGERMSLALRVGVEPDVRKVAASQVFGEAVNTADAVSRRHPTGLVAFITMDPLAVARLLRKGGWTKRALSEAWMLHDRTVVVLHADDARGLEFDGVVVIEPADFPENVGRQGVLYTSLTRATQELAVIHSKALPGGLRPPGR